MVITKASREHHGISNHQQIHFLFKRLFRYISKKTSKLRVTGPFVFGIHPSPVDSLCEGNPPVMGGFPTQRASNMEKIPFHYIIMVIRDVQSIRLQCLSVGSHKPVCQVHLAGVLCLCWALAGCRLLNSHSLTAVTLSVGFETCACVIG